MGAYSCKCSELGHSDDARGSSGGSNFRAWDEKEAGDGLFFVYTKGAKTCAICPVIEAQGGAILRATC